MNINTIKTAVKQKLALSKLKLRLRLWVIQKYREFDWIEQLHKILAGYNNILV